MPVVRCEPEALVLPRFELDNPHSLVLPTLKQGEFSFFTQPIIDSILENLKYGLTVSDCAALVSVPVSQVEKWIEDNKGNFGNLVAKAKVEFKKFHLLKINRGKSDWKPSAFIVERKFRDEYGRDALSQNFTAGKQVFMIGGKEIAF